MHFTPTEVVARCVEEYRAAVAERPGPPVDRYGPSLPNEYSDARLKELTGPVWGGRSYDELDAIGGMLIGSPDQIAEKVAGLEAIGCRSLELFAGATIRPRCAAG